MISRTTICITGLMLLAFVSYLVYGATISENALTGLLPPWAVRNIRIASVFLTGATVGSAITLIIRARWNGTDKSAS